jgi:hypothetical protein
LAASFTAGGLSIGGVLSIFRLTLVLAVFPVLSVAAPEVI